MKYDPCRISMCQKTEDVCVIYTWLRNDGDVDITISFSFFCNCVVPTKNSINLQNVCQMIDCFQICLKVAQRFLMAVKECSGPNLNMAFFINYDAGNIIKQAEESSLRFQQGTKQILHIFLLLLNVNSECFLH